jgi:hypothetical protein
MVFQQLLPLLFVARFAITILNDEKVAVFNNNLLHRELMG